MVEEKTINLVNPLQKILAKLGKGSQKKGEFRETIGGQ